MFCRFCGKEIPNDSNICPYCGGKTSNANSYGGNYGAPYTNRTNVLAIVGFIFAFFMPLVGLICSILGYSKAKNEGLNNGTLALAGIILSVLGIISVIFLSAIMFWAFGHFAFVAAL